MPTDPDKYYHPITYADAKWKIIIYYDDLQKQEHQKTIGDIVGTEEMAYKETINIVKTWKEKSCNQNLYLKEVLVNIDESSCPEELRENYVPTHSLNIKYPQKFRPPWTSFDNLIIY